VSLLQIYGAGTATNNNTAPLSSLLEASPFALLLLQRIDHHSTPLSHPRPTTVATTHTFARSPYFRISRWVRPLSHHSLLTLPSCGIKRTTSILVAHTGIRCPALQPAPFGARLCHCIFSSLLSPLFLILDSHISGVGIRLGVIGIYPANNCI
jgi:hypothetical protein